VEFRINKHVIHALTTTGMWGLPIIQSLLFHGMSDVQERPPPSFFQFFFPSFVFQLKKNRLIFFEVDR
jgi:hypothetical protein